MSVYDRLHERLREREAKGLAEYGKAVEDAGVDFLAEAIGELLDACAYLEAHRQRRRERGEKAWALLQRAEYVHTGDLLEEDPWLQHREDCPECERQNLKEEEGQGECFYCRGEKRCHAHR